MLRLVLLVLGSVCGTTLLDMMLIEEMGEIVLFKMWFLLLHGKDLLYKIWAEGCVGFPGVGAHAPVSFLETRVQHSHWNIIDGQEYRNTWASLQRKSVDWRKFSA